MRWAKESHLLDKISGSLEKLTGKIYISDKGTFPLLVGLVFGISYGAGVIIQATKEDNLSQEDATLINVFLALCHSVVEDTLIFSAIGGSIGIILGLRMFLAIMVTYLFARFILKMQKNVSEKKVLSKAGLKE